MEAFDGADERLPCAIGRQKIQEDAWLIATTAFRIPYHLQNAFEKELRKLQRDDIIEPCASEWSSPMLVIRGPTEGSEL